MQTATISRKELIKRIANHTKSKSLAVPFEFLFSFESGSQFTFSDPATIKTLFPEIRDEATVTVEMKRDGEASEYAIEYSIRVFEPTTSLQITSGSDYDPDQDLRNQQAAAKDMQSRLGGSHES